MKNMMKEKFERGFSIDPKNYLDHCHTADWAALA